MTTLTTTEAAAVLGVTSGTIGAWRSTGRGPLYRRLADGRIMYDRADVEAWQTAPDIRGYLPPLPITAVPVDVRALCRRWDDEYNRQPGIAPLAWAAGSQQVTR